MTGFLVLDFSPRVLFRFPPAPTRVDSWHPWKTFTFVYRNDQFAVEIVQNPKLLVRINPKAGDQVMATFDRPSGAREY